MPGAEWEKVAPAAVGLDAAKLDQIAQVAESGKSKCLVVVRDGKLAGEWYFRGTNEHSAQDVFSMTKSVSSTLVGIAQDDGDLKITDHASTWIPQWKNTPAAAVTVRDLLSNDSGREWSPSDRLRATARGRGSHRVRRRPPASATARTGVGVQQLRDPDAATGRPSSNRAGPGRPFAQQRLFGPLGMTDTRMTTDRPATRRCSKACSRRVATWRASACSC